MKKVILIFCLFLISNLKAQTTDFTALDLTKTVEEINFKPTKRLKNFTQQDVKKFILSKVQDRMLKQLNINAWMRCKKSEEGFQLYNLYYNKITKTYYNTRCLEINALMEIDGIIE